MYTNSHTIDNIGHIWLLCSHLLLFLCVCSPLKLLNRHNEVWYVAEGQLICTDPQEPAPAHTSRLTLTHSQSTDSVSDTLSKKLSYLPSLTPSNLSVNATAYNGSTQMASDTPSLSLSNVPPSLSSNLTADTAIQHPTPKSSSPIPLSLPVEFDGNLWNNRANNPQDSQADSNPVGDPVEDAHEQKPDYLWVATLE